MSNTNTGGPAFPSAFTGEDPGMTLRDYFAAKAMQSLIRDEKWDWAEIPSGAYEMADAMLKARQA
jgi:hypothetical protein